LESHGVSFREATRVWGRVALLSSAGRRANSRHAPDTGRGKKVDRRNPIPARPQLLHVLPGPEAHQLAIYIGWLLHRTRGGIVAGTLFVLPGLISLGVLSWVYATFGSIGGVQGFFFGLKAAVLAVVLEAVMRVGRRALRSRAMLVIAALAFFAICFFGVPFSDRDRRGGSLGFIGNAAGLKGFEPSAHSSKSVRAEQAPAAIDAAFNRALPEHVRPRSRASSRLLPSD